MITRADIHSILITSAAIDSPAGIDDDAELVIDSITLVRIKHVLEEQHGIVLDSQVEDLNSSISVNEFHAYLARCFPDRVTSAEVNTRTR